MYALPEYKEQDRAKVIAFMQANPFVIITGNSAPYPVATQVPIEISVEGDTIILSGHMMRNTDHHKAFLRNPEVLVLFPGPHTQVSASWYTNPNMGSTWNYMTVHARGTISFMDESGTIQMVQNITQKYEGQDRPSSFQHLSKEYVDGMVKAIAGFSISITKLDNVFKLSQNRDEESRKNIILKLRERGGDNNNAIAMEIENRL